MRYSSQQKQDASAGIFMSHSIKKQKVLDKVFCSLIDVSVEINNCGLVLLGCTRRVGLPELKDVSGYLVDPILLSVKTRNRQDYGLKGSHNEVKKTESNKNFNHSGK